MIHAEVVQLSRTVKSALEDAKGKMMEKVAEVVDANDPKRSRSTADLDGDDVTRTLPTLLGLKFNRASVLDINPTSPYNASLASARLFGQQARLSHGHLPVTFISQTA